MAWPAVVGCRLGVVAPARAKEHAVGGRVAVRQKKMTSSPKPHRESGTRLCVWGSAEPLGRVNKKAACGGRVVATTRALTGTISARARESWRVVLASTR
jgi:hypothetical protein